MTDPGNDTSKTPRDDRLVSAYERMLDHAREGIREASDATPRLRDMLDRVRDQMVELGELTREEGQKISDYIQRDIEDAAAYLAETGDDLRQWWRFDLELIEQRLLDSFTSVADQTSLSWTRWAEQARRASLYQAGQITGPGTLICDGCGAETHFTRTGRIPPCSDCGGLVFRRPGADDPPERASD